MDHKGEMGPTPHFQSNCAVITAFTGKDLRAEREGNRYAVKAH